MKQTGKNGGLKFQKVLWILIIAALLVFFYYISRPTVPLSDCIWGAYRFSSTCFISIETPYSCYADDTFYYSDTVNDYYIAGQFEEISEGTYRFVCSREENKQMIPDQTAAIQNRTMTLQIDGQPITFQKVSDIPYFAGDRSIYS